MSSLLSRLNTHALDPELIDAQKGTYAFSNGSEYRGGFTEGRFDGAGTLFFPNGGKFVAHWKLGKLVKGSYYYADGLQYEVDEWSYCTDADRRFWSEIQNGIRLGDSPQLTDAASAPLIPYGTYDLGDGYFDPVQGKIFDYKGAVKRVASKEESKWAVEKCRVGIERITASAVAAASAQAQSTETLPVAQQSQHPIHAHAQPHSRPAAQEPAPGPASAADARSGSAHSDSHASASAEQAQSNGESESELCPATTGGVHAWVDGFCSECGCKFPA